MANLAGLTGQSGSRVPTPPRGETIARYRTYLEAQRAVDYLSDHEFPVQQVTIVGTGLKMVERVTGRLTYARAAMAGAGSGLYFGFFVGLLLLLGGEQNGLLAGPLFGIAFGILYGLVVYGLSRGRRDFTSTSQIVASEYEVLCLPEKSDAALTLLRRLPGGTGLAEADTLPGTWSSAARTRAELSPTAALSPWGPPPAADAVPSPGAPPVLAPPEEPALTYGEAIERQRLERQRLERLAQAKADDEPGGSER